MIDREAPNSADDAVGRVVESFLTRFRRGERPALNELVGRHPELAEQLHEIIPALVELEQLGGVTGSFSGSRATAIGPIDASHPESLGDYRILRRIGSGGMGVVYEAERESLKSRVALKVMHPRFRTDEKYLRRFHVEARSAAGLHHTNIVSVFDYGEHGGVCYYAMQYIRGQPLDCVLQDLRRLKEEGPLTFRSLTPDFRNRDALPNAPESHTAAQSLLTGRFVAAEATDQSHVKTGPIETTLLNRSRTIEERAIEKPEPSREPLSFGSSSLGDPIEGPYYREVARVCAQVADALDYAHRAGVLHRDIKPPNLLLDALGNVWVTDFGLAKMVESDDTSHSQDLVGTLRYMAPERFRGISDRSGDIYALGATLYELVTLRPAFDGADQLRLIDRIVHEPPEQPRMIDRHVPRDLETIVLKALAKDPKDRFRSAHEMAEELRKFVNGHPIQSRPISFVERFWRWCKRDPWLAGANVAAAALAIALTIGSTIAAVVYRNGQERYATVAKDAREKLFDARTSQASASRLSRQVGQRFKSLEAIAEAVKIGRELHYPADRFDQLRDEAIACLMMPDLKPPGRPIPVPEAHQGFTFDKGMTRYAIRRIDGTIEVRRISDDQEIARFTAKGDRDVWVFVLSPDGKYLASRDGNTISVYDIDRKTLCWKAPENRSKFVGRFSPDSRRIAVAGTTDTVLIHDLENGQDRTWIPAPGFRDLAFGPDGKQIAIGCNGIKPSCSIHDAATGQLIRSFSIPIIDKLFWNFDGATLAVVHSNAKKITLFSAERGVAGATLEGHVSLGIEAGFLPAGSLVASNGWEGRLRLWDLASGRERLSLSGGANPVFSQDGRIFIQQGSEVRPYQVEPALEYTTLGYPSALTLDYSQSSIHPDGRILALGTDHGVILWDVARKAELGFLPIGNAWHSRFLPSGDLLTNGSAGVLRWTVQRDPSSGAIRIGPPRLLPLRGSHCGIAYDQTGQIIAVAQKWSVQVALKDRTINIGPLDDCRGVSISPDGKWLSASSHANGGVTIWSLPDGARIARLPLEGGANSLFSPDGKWLVTIQGASSRLWEVGSWREVRRFEGALHDFSPEGRLGIFRDSGNILQLIEIETGRILAKLERPDLYSLQWLRFSPDGSRLVGTTNEPPSSQVIDLRAIRRELANMDLDWDAPAFSEDDPARSDLPPLQPIEFEYGPLQEHLEPYPEIAEAVLKRYTEKNQKNPKDVDALHQRAHALAALNRPSEAMDAISYAIWLRPNDAHFLHFRARLHANSYHRYQLAIDDLEEALSLDPSNSTVREQLSTYCNNLAWELGAEIQPGPDIGRALELSRRAVELRPGQQVSLNTRGVILYRAGHYAEAVKTLEQSLEASRGQYDGFDLFFLAMAHHHLGNQAEALRCRDRAIDWWGRKPKLTGTHIRELTAFRAEAEKILAQPIGELPDDVFEPSSPRDQPAKPRPERVRLR
jgi:serine/threonine protein kinase/WD40 repeat protein